MDINFVKNISSDDSLSRVALLCLLYLKTIKRFKGNQTEIADNLGLNRSTVSESLALLTQRGYIKKVENKRDKRLRDIEFIKK